MFMKIFLVWYCNHQFFSHRIRSPPPLRWNEGDISRTFIFMPFHYWLCVMFWCAFFCLLCDIFYVPISSRKQMMTKSKLGWMQCQRKKEKSFYWIFTSHSWLFKKKNWNLCVDIYSHADFHSTLYCTGKDIKHFILFIAAHAIK